MELTGIFGKIEAASAGSYRFIASTETLDTQKRVLKLSGWDLADFKRNPVMLWDHGLSAAIEREPIGRVTEIGIDPARNALLATVQPATVLSPEAERLWAMVDAGDLNAVSIGAVPTGRPEYQFSDDGAIEAAIYNGQKLTELSLVSVPSNPDALRIAASAFGPDAFASVFDPAPAPLIPATRRNVSQGRLTPNAADGRRIREQLSEP